MNPFEHKNNIQIYHFFRGNAHNLPVFIIKTAINRYIYLLLYGDLSSILWNKKIYSTNNTRQQIWLFSTLLS